MNKLNQNKVSIFVRKNLKKKKKPARKKVIIHM